MSAKASCFLTWHPELDKINLVIILHSIINSAETYFIDSTKGTETLPLESFRLHLECQVVYVSPSIIREPIDSFNNCAPLRESTRLPLAMFKIHEEAETIY